MLALNTINQDVTAWNALDWIIIAVLVACIAWGAYRGLRSQLLALLGFIVAFIVASRNYEYLIPWVRKRLFTEQQSSSFESIRLLSEEQTGQSAVHAVIAFSLLFLFVLLAMGLLKHLLTKLSVVRPIKRLDRLIGALLGVIQFMCLWCIAYVILMAWPQGEFSKLVDQSFWMLQSAEWLPVGFATAVQWIQWF